MRFLRCPGSSASLALHDSFLRSFAALRSSAAAARAAFRPAGCKPHSNPSRQRRAEDVPGRNGDRGRGFPGRPGPFLRSAPSLARLRPAPRWRWRERGGAAAGAAAAAGRARCVRPGWGGRGGASLGGTGRAWGRGMSLGRGLGRSRLRSF